MLAFHMTFETNRDVLDWYERQPRTLTPEFLGSIPWNRVKDHALDDRFIPVLFYMRDIESLTDVYYRQMLRTPTGKDPYISKFMERWGTEELLHGEVLNRFLNELGIETGEKWQTQVRRAVSTAYHANAYLLSTLTNFVGRRFTATHMTFGAIHEMSTTQAYRRLMKLADHPVLTHILNGIMREEAAHTQFYWSVARLELSKNAFSQKMARFVIEHSWAPVGQGSKPKKQTDYTIATLFGGEDGLQIVDKAITQRIRQLPGFAELTVINEVAQQIAENAGLNLEGA